MAFVSVFSLRSSAFEHWSSGSPKCWSDSTCLPQMVDCSTQRPDFRYGWPGQEATGFACSRLACKAGAKAPAARGLAALVEGVRSPPNSSLELAFGKNGA